MLTFRLYITSWGFFDGSGVKLIFHWYAQLLILSKSIFEPICDELTSWITEYREASSAKPSPKISFKRIQKHC